MIFGGDRDELGRYVREMADLMGLCSWHLTLGNDPPDKDNDEDDASTHPAAQVNVTYGRKQAVICFDPGWPEWEPEELRSVVVHELIHCHQEPMRWAMNNIKHVVSLPMYNVIFATFTDALEVATDGMAMVWSEHLPLPIRETDAGEEAA